jgi:hypothetical protein
MMRPSRRMSPEALLDHWRRTYGETPLVGHVLRDRFPRRWLRIHNLPDSKRYAETEDEHQEILRRQNTLLSDLIGDDRPFELVFGYYGGEDRVPEDVLAALRGLGPVFLAMDPAGEPDGASEGVAGFPLLKAQLAWQPRALDVVLRAVADDVLATPLLVSVERCRIVAPYDGGVDVIVESEELRDQLEGRYRSWLSKHPAGL